MQITNQAAIDAANTSFRAMFEKFGTAEPGVWDRYTEVVQTDSEINTFDFITAFPQVEKWVGPKTYAMLRAYAWTGRLEPYAKNLELDFMKVRYDKMGMVGGAQKKFLTTTSIYDKVVTDELISNAGAGPLGYDGVALFSTSHPHAPGGGVQSNTSTTVLSYAQHEAVLVAGSELTDETAEPLQVSYDAIMVGPFQARLAREITGSKTRVVPIDNTGKEASTGVVAAGQVDNYMANDIYTGGSIDVIVNPRLIGTRRKYYYYFDTKKGVKPILLLEGRKPEAIAQTAMESEVRFNKNKLRWSVEADLAPMGGLWQVAFAGIVP